MLILFTFLHKNAIINIGSCIYSNEPQQRTYKMSINIHVNILTITCMCLHIHIPTMRFILIHKETANNERHFCSCK